MKYSLSFWDIDAKKNLLRMVKGKNVPMFEIYSKEKAKENETEPTITDVVYHTGMAPKTCTNTKRLAS